MQSVEQRDQSGTRLSVDLHQEQSGAAGSLDEGKLNARLREAAWTQSSRRCIEGATYLVHERVERRQGLTCSGKGDFDTSEARPQQRGKHWWR